MKGHEVLPRAYCVESAYLSLAFGATPWQNSHSRPFSKPLIRLPDQENYLHDILSPPYYWVAMDSEDRVR